MNQALLNFVLALSINDILHNFIETKSAREKLARLAAYMSKKAYKELPVNINTRAKAYGVSLLAFLIPVTVIWSLLGLLHLTDNDVLKIAAIALITANFTLSGLMDKYHVEIEHITKPFKN